MDGLSDTRVRERAGQVNCFVLVLLGITIGILSTEEGTFV